MSGTAGNLPGIGPINPHSEDCEERITVLELHSLVDSCGCEAIWKMLQEFYKRQHLGFTQCNLNYVC